MHPFPNPGNQLAVKLKKAPGEGWKEGGPDAVGFGLWRWPDRRREAGVIMPERGSRKLVKYSRGVLFGNWEPAGRNGVWESALC